MIPAFNTTLTATIFDLDGVLVDTAHYHYLAWKRLANELEFDLSIEENERLKGVSRKDSLNIILALGKLLVTEEQKAVLSDKKNAWFVEYLHQMKPDAILPGAKEVLIMCRERGLKIGLGSSSKNARTVLEVLHLENFFDVIVDGTMIKHSKPHPEIFLLGATLLNTYPANCVVFEDAEAGVEAALAAGMKCIGVGSADQLHKASRVVPNLINFSFDPVTLVHNL